VLGVIDGDLQHPPHVLLQLLSAIEQGADLAVAGCVAKTGGDLVKVVFILTALNRRHLIHEPQAPVQMASLPI
jgi:hypothetical protein